MAKSIIIPQGTYTVGVDFPQGSYFFNSLDREDVSFELVEDSNDGDYRSFNLDEENSYECRLSLRNRDYFTIDGRVQVTVAEMISFD